MSSLRLAISRGLNWLAECFAPGYSVVTLYLPEQTASRLSALCDYRNEQSILELVSTAVTVYERLAGLESLGYEVSVVHADGWHKMQLKVSTGEFVDVYLHLKPISPVSN